MNKINIQEYKIRREVPPPLKPTNRVAVDTEFVNMDKKKLHRPTGEFALCQFYFGTDEVYIVDNVQDLQQAFDNIEPAGWIFHNAKFDIFHLRRYIHVPVRMKLWDTQLVEQVMFSGKYDEYNLAACLRRRDIYMEKEVRDTFSVWDDDLSQDQLEYSAIDVIGTYKLFVDQRTKIDDDDLRVWKNFELPYLWCILGKRGIKINREKWLALAEESETKALEISSKYGIEVQKLNKRTGKPCKTTEWQGMNLNSDAQCLEKMHELGYKDLESVGEKVIKHLYDKEPFVKDRLDFKMYKTRVEKYGKKWFEDWVETDGKVYPDIFQREAETGRSCVAADTVLETNLGCFNISDLDLTGSKNYEILTHRGRYKKILRKIYKGKEQMFLVTLENGSSIKCTMKHRFLTNNGWKALKEITDEDRILTPETAHQWKEENS